MHFRSKNHENVRQFRPYPLIKHYLGTTNPLCKYRNNIPKLCNIRFSVEFFALAGLESQNLQYSAIFGMPLQLEGVLTFRESTIVRVFPLSSPLGLDGLSKVHRFLPYKLMKYFEFLHKPQWRSVLKHLPVKTNILLFRGSNPGRAADSVFFCPVLP